MGAGVFCRDAGALAGITMIAAAKDTEKGTSLTTENQAEIITNCRAVHFRLTYIALPRARYRLNICTKGWV